MWPPKESVNGIAGDNPALTRARALKGFIRPIAEMINNHRRRNRRGAISKYEVSLDLPQYARDEIKTFISVNFKGHALANLVAEVLRSQGFHTLVSPPGPDRGVDILAGRGHLGFDQPRFCVQVKSGDTRTDVTTVRELTGVMNNHKASQGLLVSWSGYTRDAISEAKNHYF